jgi:hypothetical protein
MQSFTIDNGQFLRNTSPFYSFWAGELFSLERLPGNVTPKTMLRDITKEI